VNLAFEVVKMAVKSLYKDYVVILCYLAPVFNRSQNKATSKSMFFMLTLLIIGAFAAGPNFIVPFLQ